MRKFIYITKILNIKLELSLDFLTKDLADYINHSLDKYKHCN